MPTLKTRYIGELRTEVTHTQSGDKIVTDAPLDNNGKGEHFSPTDLLAASLGSCMLTIMGITAERSGFSIEGATIETTKHMSKEPRRVGELNLRFTFPSNYSEKERRLIEGSAKVCPVEFSLHPDVIRTIEFIYPE